MTSEKPRLANGDMAAIVIAGSFAIFVANLTLLVALVDVEWVTKLLLKPMWPGLYLAYIFTGKSDGTPSQQAAAPWIAAIINAAIYFAAVLAIRLIWRHLALDASTPSKESNPEEAA